MCGRLRAPLRLFCALGAVWTLGTNVAQSEQPDSKEKVDQIIVTASRLETTQADVGSSVTVITQQELQDGKYPNVVQALRKVPGLDIVQSGAAGGNAAAFIRGADSAQTLVLLDGIELNNPASPNRAFNLANLTLENIERIEVIRGPQSSIYGSDSMGGVINIISKKPQEGAHSFVSAEAGSYNSFNNSGHVSYGGRQLDFSAGITQQDIGNISAADASDGNVESDAYRNTSLSSRIKYKPSDRFEGAATTRYTRSNAGLDNNGGVGGDDPNRHYGNEEFFARGEITGHLIKDVLKAKTWSDYTSHNLADKNDPDAASADLLRSSYKGELLDFGSSLTWAPRRYFSAVFGGETQAERATSKYFSDGQYGQYSDDMGWKDARTNSLFIESKSSYTDRFFVDAGMRYDHHSIFGTRNTFRIAPAWYVTDTTKLRSSVGTGFKAPSLAQLYSPYGNQQLAPETSVGWDIGVDQKVFDDQLALELTFFDNDYTDLITFNPSTFVLENVQSAYTQGVEFGVSSELSDQVSLRSAYTYTETHNRHTDESLLRRPRHKGSITLNYQPTNRIVAQLQWRAYGTRFDYDYSSVSQNRTTLSGYAIVDVSLTYRATNQVDLFTRIDNLFDQEYQEVYGYGSLGCAAYGGIKVKGVFDGIRGWL